MRATERSRASAALPQKRHASRGATLVEFALTALVFFSLIFFVMETARALYLWNTLQQVTRRAAHQAAITDFSDGVAMLALRQQALMGGAGGGLPLGAPVTAAHLRIDYLSLARNGDGSMALTPMAPASLPSCPQRARLNCIADPNGAACIRFVRVRICAPDNRDGCAPVAYQAMTALLPFNITLPTSVTISKAESLGLQAGAPLCP